ncbi:MAG: PulJ/GspJ family protein, partial [Armatimonadota bacterium]
MMARCTRSDKRSMARRPGRAGFTLIEVLVVLAILVILFGMLFAPMIASLDMVTLGQSRVTMQSAVRNAMEDMRREVSNAVYIYPTPGVQLKGADGLLGTADDVRIPNCSELVFVGPERTATGELVEPISPRVDSAGRIVATRVRAALRDETAAYSEANPFVLVREEGYYTRHEDANAVWWEFTNIGGATDPIRNLLTPRSGYDIPVTRSVCTTCGAVVEGYITSCPSGCTGEIIYLHDGLQLAPERITGEVLQPTANHTIYQARHGAWAGLYNSGAMELNDLLPHDPADPLATLGASPLDPRIMVVNPTDMSIKRDAYGTTDDSNTILTWNSDTGSVQVGAATGRWVNVTNATDYIDPRTSPQYYDVQVQAYRPGSAAPPPPDDAVDDYDGDGVLQTAPRQWDLVPIYPSLGPLTCNVCGGTYDPAQYNPGDPCPTPGCSGTLVSTA